MAFCDARRRYDWRASIYFSGREGLTMTGTNPKTIEDLHAHIERARSEARLERGRLENLPRAPHVGDLYQLPIEGEHLVHVVVIEERPSRSNRWVVLAADENPALRSGVDVSLEEGLTVRCDRMSNVGSPVLEADARVGQLATSVVETLLTCVQTNQSRRGAASHDESIEETLDAIDGAMRRLRERNDRGREIRPPYESPVHQRSSPPEFAQGFAEDRRWSHPDFDPLKNQPAWDELDLFGGLRVVSYPVDGVYVEFRGPRADAPTVCATYSGHMEYGHWEDVHGDGKLCRTRDAFPWEDDKVELFFGEEEHRIVVLQSSVEK